MKSPTSRLANRCELVLPKREFMERPFMECSLFLTTAPRW
jgi:hypothetical protein